MNQKTKDEIDFLRALALKKGPTVRAKLLRRYLASMPLRHKWERVEPDVVEAYIRLELGEGSKP